jgi:uncharacterized protein (DUF1778 family)
MSMTGRNAAARKPVNLRLEDETRALIDHAAAIRGTTRSSFMVEAARQAAEQAILDQALINVSAEAFEAFTRLLDAPPAPNERLRRTMTSTPPWR